MRRLRMYDPDYYCEVTIRAQDGEFVFDPNDIDLRQRIYGVFAEAARQYRVAIFIFHVMSNHYHGLYGYDSPGQFEAFLAYLHGNLARLANESIGRDGQFWCKPKVLAVSRDAGSVAARFRYIMGQAVRAEMCRYPGEFPGASAMDALLYGARLVGRKVDRSRRCRDAARLKSGAKTDADYETEVEVPLSVPHCWTELTPADLRRLYLGIADELAAEAGAPSQEGQSGARDPGQALAEPGAALAQAQQPQEPTQVPGTCLNHEIAMDFVTPLPVEQPVEQPFEQPPELPVELSSELPPVPPPAAEVTAPADLAATAQPTPPAKVHVPQRKAEDGGRYRHGKVKPKVRETGRKRSKMPMLFSVHARLVAEYEERYKLAVEAYYAAKRVWRQKSKYRKGALRSAAIELPPWMCMGTLPRFVAG